MVSYFEDESFAAKLREQLKAAYSSELKLLCGLGFFARFTESTSPGLEGYLREFIPPLASVSRLCDAAEFLPEDHLSLQALLKLLQPYRETIKLDQEYATLANLERSIESSLYARPQAALAEPIKLTPKRATVAVTCLFVEDYFYLDHDSRGRLLTLYITAEPRPPGDDPYEIDLRNPVDSDRDPFIDQARKSIEAARIQLAARFGLPSKKRYRIEINVNHQGARFTGDSLGVAIAVGTVAAITQIESFRQRLAVSPQTAFTGALSPDGKLEPIDGEGLRKKIHRAYFSDLKCLIVPREHITSAWDYLKALEGSSSSRPSGPLDLVGVERLESIIDDPRLLPIETVCFPAYVGRKLRQKARSTWIEVPALLLLLAIAFYFFAPNAWKFWRDHNPSFALRSSNMITILSADSLHLWDIPLAGPIETAPGDTANYRFVDLDGKGHNEFVFIPHYRQPYPWADSLIAFSSDGKLLFKRDCEILHEYYGDSLPMFRESVALWITKVDGKLVLITQLFQNTPARQHIKFWDATGRQLGWYINAGGCQYQMVRDLDGDGSEELLFRCFNNRMQCVATFAVKPDGCQGASPPYKDPEYDLTWMKHGNQLRYVIYPMTDIGGIDQTKPYDDFGPIEDLRDGTFKTISVENAAYAWMYYIFGPDLRVRSAFCSDQYTKRHQDLNDRGVLKPAHTVDQCVQHAIDTVSYWTDSGWVTEGQLRAAGK